MSDFNVGLAGQENKAGDIKKNFLPVYAGEILTAYQRHSVTQGRVLKKTITSGISTQFPVTGRASTSDIKYHTPGDKIVTSTVGVSTEVVIVDDMLYYAKAFDLQDEAQSHFDYRNAIANQGGEALTRDEDYKVFLQAILGARASNSNTDLPGGTVIESASFSTDANAAVAAIYEAITELQNKDVTDLSQMAIYLSYNDYNNIIQNSDKIINKDFTEGSNGGLDSGVLKMIGGLPLIPTNNIPKTNVTGTNGARYDVNASTTKAVIFHKDAIAVVELMGLKTSSSWLEEYQHDLVVSTKKYGMKYLRPEACVEIRTATPV